MVAPGGFTPLKTHKVSANVNYHTTIRPPFEKNQDVVYKVSDSVRLTVVKFRAIYSSKKPSTS
jgi:hypothetical protein